MLEWAADNPQLALAIIVVIGELVNRFFDWLKSKTTANVVENNWDSYIKDLYSAAIMETAAAIQDGSIKDEGFKARLVDKLLTRLTDKWRFYGEKGEVPYSLINATTAQLLEAISRTENGEV